MINCDDIEEKPIHRDGKIIGYRLYRKNGIFGLTFYGYRWIEDTK